MEDQSQQKLLTIDQINIDFRLLSLLKSEKSIENIALKNLATNIKIDTTGKSNFQFIIDYFAPEEKSNPQKTNFTIETITLDNASIGFINQSNNAMPLGGKNQFDSNYISVNNLNTLLSLQINNSNSAISVKYLNFEEESGFKVDDFNTQVILSEKLIELPYLNIELPNSQVSLDSIEVSNFEALRLNLNKSTVYLPDLQAFSPQLKYLNKPLTLSSHINGNIQNIKTEDINIAYGDDIALDADISISNLDSIENANFNCNINQIKFDIKSIQDIVANIVQRPFIMPNEMHNLGKCNYTGTIIGKTSDLTLDGKLITDIGAIDTDVRLASNDNFKEIDVNGKVESKLLRLAKLMPKSGLGNVSFTTNTSVKLNEDKTYKSDIELVVHKISYQNYTYNNITIDGEMTPELFTGKILLDDPNGYFSFDGELSDINGQKTINFTSEIDKLNLNKLNIIKEYPELDISLNLNSHLKGVKFENMTGHINIDSLLINNNPKSYFLKQFSLLSSHTEEYSKFNINSDIINGDLMGNYAMSTLVDDIISSAISEHLPMLSQLVKIKKAKYKNKLDFKFDIEPLEPLLSTLDIEWSTTGITTIKGEFNSQQKLLNAEVYTESITDGINKFDSISFIANNNNAINIQLSMATDLPAGHLNGGITIGATGGVITTDVMWDNNNPNQLYSGEIIAKTEFHKDDDKYTVKSKILPTSIYLQNREWEVGSSRIWSDFKTLGIENFSLTCTDNQTIIANGIASADSLDAIMIGLQDISLDYICGMLPKSEISFGGNLTGYASISQALSPLPRINADITSEKFVFDNAEVGNAHAECHFDLETSSLQFDGAITSDNNDTTAKLYGGYYIPKDSLDIIGQANGLTLSFINYYIQDVFGTIKGEAYADVHIHGFTKSQKVEVDVEGYADNASLRVDFLNTEYSFSDSVKMDKNIIDFGRIELTDQEGNKGVLSGAINHNYFKDMNFNLGIQLNNMLALNTTKKESESFYGKAYATGGVTISGTEEEVKIACKATTNNGTKVVIPIDSYYASDNTFITFVDHSKIEEEAEIEAKKEKNNKEIKEEEETNSNVVIDLMLDMTPSATVDLIIDSKAGDMLSATGTGSIRVTYDVNAEDINMYGNYQLDQGAYIFTFQNLLRKEFRIKEGSSILWAGDPLAANVNIDAYYQLTADLSEILDESILQNTTRTSVPVQCILGLTGALTTPTIKFDMNLPNSDEELNRALEYSVNTEELMNRQIIGLLLMGKFLSTESMNTNVISQNELYSVVSSTLSSQLNNWASQMFDNWGFGVNFRTSGEGEMRSNEYEFNFLYTPTDKISINGNVGYRDDELSSTNFIGDFDLEYKLIESGKLKGKAYTHTNDYSEFKNGLTTQGIGLVYSESFNTLPELWQSWINNSKRKKEKRRTRRAERREQVEKAKKASEASISASDKINKKEDNEASDSTATSNIGD